MREKGIIVSVCSGIWYSEIGKGTHIVVGGGMWNAESSVGETKRKLCKVDEHRRAVTSTHISISRT